MKAGHTEEYVDGTSAAPWPQLDGVRPNTSPALVDDGRRSEEDGEGRGGAKSNRYPEARPRNCTTRHCFRVNSLHLLSQCLNLSNGGFFQGFWRY